MIICDYETLKFLIRELHPQEPFWKSQLFGIIIGTVLSLLSTILVNYLQNMRDDRKHLKEKREEVYEKVLNTLIPIYNSWIISKFDKTTTKKSFDIEQIEILLNIYGSQDVLKIFHNLPTTHFEASPETCEILKKLKKKVREELGIKD